MTFKDAIQEDIKVFTNSDEFAEVALFSRSGLEINVLLDKDMEAETGRIIDVITVVLSDIIDIEVNDTLTVGAVVYRYVSTFPSPVGDLMTMIRVEK